uniref:Uncharacterized protein n=1 Tax=Avena sativa TaxID=4498 RepID=A0ACD5YTN2_AVESA
MAMLLRRRLPLLRLLRPLQTVAGASTTAALSPQLPSLQTPVPAAAASPSVALGSRLGFPNARPHASASSAAAFLAAGAAAALAMLPTVAYADANEEGVVDAAVSTDAAPVEDLARKERNRIMELIASQGMPPGLYPKFDVAVKGQKGVPLLYVPLEIIMSKYYGESERLLGSVFSLANDLPDGGIIFLDEVDSFAIARDSEMHEATRRILSVILRQIDGFEQDRRVVVIAATNRKEDLDPALISRFDSIICFGLPDQQSRAEIAAQYAKHLTKPELVQFSLVTEEMAGRDIRDICMQAERHWASKFIRGQIPKDEKGETPLPPVDEYVSCAVQRRKSLPDRTRPTSRPSPLKLA